MSKKATLSQKQLKAIKARIDEKLRIRCINVETTLKLVEKKNKKIVFELRSTKFNTIPVLHSEIEIRDFGGNVWRNENEKDITRFNISVNAMYNGNSVGLFNVYGQVRDKNNNYIFFENEVGTFLD